MIIFGANDSIGSYWRGRRLSRSVDVVMAGKIHHPCSRWMTSALDYNPSLYSLFLKDLSSTGPDLIVSDDDPWTRKAALDLQIPLVKVSSFENRFDKDIIVESPFPSSSVRIFDKRSTSDDVDVIILMRNQSRATKMKELMGHLPYTFTFHSAIDDEFWFQEKRSYCFISEADTESLSVALSGQHGVILIPSSTDTEQKKNAKIAESFGAINLGEVEGGGVFAERWLSDAIETACPLTMIPSSTITLVDKLKSLGA
jgi:hypothetical protein